MSCGTMTGDGNEILFGDSTFVARDELSSLLARQDNPILTTFFEHTECAIRTEIEQDIQRRSVFLPLARFRTFTELLLRLRDFSTSQPAISLALSCIHQSACFISHYSQPGVTYPDPSKTRIFGVRNGLLVGAAASCAKSWNDFLPLATTVVRVAFRIGLSIGNARDAIDLGHANRSWASFLPAISRKVVQMHLDRFLVSEPMPTVWKPYISAYSPAGVTISGPPSILKKITSSAGLASVRSMPLKLFGPDHAAHIYDAGDVSQVMMAVEGIHNQLQVQTSIIPIFDKASHAEASIESTFYGLLSRITYAILALPADLKYIDTYLGETPTIGNASTRPLVISGSSSMLQECGLQNVAIELPVITSNPSLPSPRNSPSAKFAIVGFSGRFPNAQNPEEFWEILRDGLDTASQAPGERWIIEPQDQNVNQQDAGPAPFGCWIKEPGQFDAKFFNMTSMEVPHVDPAQRIALMTAYEAIENAGLVPDATPSSQRTKVGVFMGTTSNDYGETNGVNEICMFSIPGNCRAFIPGRQNFFFNFSGASYSLDGACASSIYSLHLACNAIRKGEIHTALVGGTNVLTNPNVSLGLHHGRFLSKTGNCKTFDYTADGYCRGEGVASFVVKRYEDAIADNDNIAAVILATSTNHSAEGENIMRPHVPTQRANFENCFVSSHVDPDTVDYVEMHGTGTQIGDSREFASVTSVFANDTRTTPRSSPLYVGSAKANVGHGESVSGSVALAKVLLMFKNNLIPKHIGLKTKLNAKIPTDLDKRNVHIARKAIAWPRQSTKPRRVLLNNFSAAGGNASVLLEEAPQPKQIVREDIRTSHVVAVSAKTPKALVSNVESLITFINQQRPKLANLSYTTTARRIHHPFRIAAHGSNLKDICTQLQQQLKQQFASTPKTKPGTAPQIGFAFTGQGSQYLGMGVALLAFRAFAQEVDRLDALTQKLKFPAITPYIQNYTPGNAETSPVISQLALTCIQIALVRLWRSWGVEPAVVVGHSIGEYAALNCAGILSDADTIYLVGSRAQLLIDKCAQGTHSMLAVAASLEEILALGVDASLFEVSCQNSPSEVVLSGTVENINGIHSALAQKGLRLTTLQVPYAYHSSQVDPILDDFQAAAKHVHFGTPQIPVISPLLGKAITQPGIFGASYLAQHCRESVNFGQAISDATSETITKATKWIEIGPHPVLSGLLCANLGAVSTIASLHRKKSTWAVLTEGMSALYTAGADIKWREYHRDFEASLSLIRLPAYNWDLKNYWISAKPKVKEVAPTKTVQIPIEPIKSPQKILQSVEETPRAQATKALKRPLDLEQSIESPAKKRRYDSALPSPTSGPSQLEIKLDIATGKLQVKINALDVEMQDGVNAVDVELPKEVYNTDIAMPNAPPALAPSTSIVAKQVVTSTILKPNQTTAFQETMLHQFTWSDLQKIIVEEGNLDPAKLTPASRFADLGFDSILSTKAASRIREELAIDFDPNTFVRHPTIGHLQVFWDTRVPAAVATRTTHKQHDSVISLTETSSASPTPSPSGTISPASHSTSLSSIAVPSTTTPTLKATSSTIQTAQIPTSTRTLFLLPPSSGLSTPYIALPLIHPSLAVIGLNSPLLDPPSSSIGSTMSLNVAALANAYTAELRRRQPAGPYALGGYSGGGILAYAVTAQLLAQGESVSDLILIDAPAPGPLGISNPSNTFWDEIATRGIFAGEMSVQAATAQKVLVHVKQCMASLASYTPQPLPTNSSIKPPRTTILWASDAVQDLKSAGEASAFFTAPRGWISGAAGWEKLVGEAAEVHELKGLNHFEVLGERGAGVLAKILNQVFGS